MNNAGWLRWWGSTFAGCWGWGVVSLTPVGTLSLLRQTSFSRCAEGSFSSMFQNNRFYWLSLLLSYLTVKPDEVLSLAKTENRKRGSCLVGTPSWRLFGAVLWMCCCAVMLDGESLQQLVERHCSLDSGIFALWCGWITRHAQATEFS